MRQRTASKYAHGRSEARERPALVKLLLAEQRRLGARLRDLRLARGLSQESVAEAAGLHVKTIVLLETGTTNTTLATLVALAHVFGVRVRDLFD